MLSDYHFMSFESPNYILLFYLKVHKVWYQWLNYFQSVSGILKFYGRNSSSSRSLFYLHCS